MQSSPDIDGLAQRIDTLAAEIASAIAEIATELSKLLPQNSALIMARQRSVTRIVREVMAMLPQLNVAEATLADEARARSETDGSPPVLPVKWYQLRMRSNRLRSEMNQWHEIQALIAEQVPPRARPLYVADDVLPAALVTQRDVSDTLFADLHKMLNPAPQSDGARSYGCHADIGLSNSVFLEHAHAAYRLYLARRQRHPARFLDVGCGSGLKLLSALEFFDRADGLELDPAYVDAAQKLLGRAGRGECRVIEADALDFDGYGAYDVIYFYRPMRNEAAMQRLEAQIVSHAAPGTILIAAYGGFSVRHEALGCVHVAGNVYVAGLDSDNAQSLRRAAEHIGTSVVRRRTALKSIWEPVLASSHENGYGIRRRPPICV